MLPLIVVCAAAFAFSANYTNHAPMVGALRQEFGFDQAAAGLLTTAIFLTHALLQIPGGRLADTLGPVRVMSAALLWIVAGNAALAFAGSYGALLFWKAFTGVGTGACIIAGARYIVSTRTGRSLNLAQGLFGGSVLLGSGFVIFAVPQLLGAFGWRGAFLACAGIAAVVWIAWVLAAVPPPNAEHGAVSWRSMLFNPQLWLLGLVQMASFGLVVVVGAWITTLLGGEFHVPLKTAGLLGSCVLLLGIFIRPLGGWLLHHITVATLVRAATLVTAAGCLALGVSRSLPFSFAAILAIGAGCGLPYAGLFNRAAALFPGRAGAAMGLVNTIGITMILAGAPAVGLVADWTGQFRSSFLVLAVFASVVAAASFWIREK